MLATIILDAYTSEERRDLADAVAELCNPVSSDGWSSAGLYGFWNPVTGEILYLGLARDLAYRFKQHNGLVKCSPNGCKVDEINEYFASGNERLGYSIFVQAPSINQPFPRKLTLELASGDRKLMEYLDAISDRSIQEIKVGEGLLIEAFSHEHNTLPAWNRIGGSKEGRKRRTSGSYNVVRSFSVERQSPLAARCTIREMARDADMCYYEHNFLHGVRLNSLLNRRPFQDSLNWWASQDPGTYGEMTNKGYLARQLPI